MLKLFNRNPFGLLGTSRQSKDAPASVAVIRLESQYGSAECVRSLRLLACCRECLEKNADKPRVLVDMSGTRYCGALFLTVLLECRRLIHQLEGELILCGVPDYLRELLRATRLESLFPIVPSARHLGGETVHIFDFEEFS